MTDSKRVNVPDFGQQYSTRGALIRHTSRPDVLPTEPPASEDVDAARPRNFDGREPRATIKAMFSRNEGDDALLDEAFDAFEAAIRAEGLDVARLARALANDSDSATPDEKREVDLWSLLGERLRDAWRIKAEDVAAEYARLGGER